MTDVATPFNCQGELIDIDEFYPANTPNCNHHEEHFGFEGSSVLAMRET